MSGMVPTITPREFVSLVAGAARSAFPTTDCLTARYPIAASMARRPRRAIHGLHGLVADRPCDAVAHRLLGVAYFRTGELPLAARHLGRAFDLLSHQSTAPVPAWVALPAHLQMAALRLLLAAFLSTIGSHKLANQILLDGVKL
jgi:hypothetical protein